MMIDDLKAALRAAELEQEEAYASYEPFAARRRAYDMRIFDLEETVFLLSLAGCNSDQEQAALYQLREGLEALLESSAYLTADTVRDAVNRRVSTASIALWRAEQDERAQRAQHAEFETFWRATVARLR